MYNVHRFFNYSVPSFLLIFLSLSSPFPSRNEHSECCAGMGRHIKITLNRGVGSSFFSFLLLFYSKTRSISFLFDRNAHTILYNKKKRKAASKKDEHVPRFRTILMCLPIPAQHSLCSLQLQYELQKEKK